MEFLTRKFESLPQNQKAAIIGVMAVFFSFYGKITELVKSIGIIPTLLIVGVLGFGVWSGYKFYKENEEKKKREYQDKRNRKFANKGRVHVILMPPDQDKGTPWNILRQRTEEVIGYFVMMLKQDKLKRISLEVIANEKGAVLAVWTPTDLEDAIIQGLTASFPNTQVRTAKEIFDVQDPLAELKPEETTYIPLIPSAPPHYPMRSIRDYSLEPWQSIVPSLMRTSDLPYIGFQIVLQMPEEDWKKKGQDEIQKMTAVTPGSRSSLSAEEKARIQAIQGKLTDLNAVGVTIRAFAEKGAGPRLGQLVPALAALSATVGMGGLVPGEQVQGEEAVKALKGRYADYRSQREWIMTPQEIASLWHIPDKSAAQQAFVAARGVFLPPPQQVIVDGFGPTHRVLGRGFYPGKQPWIGWRYGFDTLVHGYLVGPTGSGKSTVMSSLAIQDILAGYGIFVLEPHRSLVADIIHAVPPEREKDVLWVNPTYATRSFGINLLDYGGNPEHRNAVAGNFMSVLQRIIGGDWEKAVRMKRIMMMAINALVEAEPLPTMIHFLAFLRHDAYRESLMERINNATVKDFWLNDFANWGQSERQSAIGPVLNRFEPLLVNPYTKHVMAQQHTTLPMRQLMDSGKIILADLAKQDERIGEAGSVLGVLIVTQLWGAAKSRSDILMRGGKPYPFFTYIDEFQNYVSQDISKILAEARKFGFGLVLANQYPKQLPDWMWSAIESNCRTKMAAALESPQDARMLTKIFIGTTEAQIRSLSAYRWLARISAGRAASPTFTIAALPPIKGKKAKQLAALYRKRNGGKLPQPSERGGIEFSPLEDVSEPDAHDENVWRVHQSKMEDMDDKEKARYLAELSEDDWIEYRRIERRMSKREFLEIVEHPDRIPDRLERIRTLSALQVETPRIIIEAEAARLEKAITGSKSDWSDGDDDDDWF